MKTWISVLSHGFAAISSFVSLSLAPVLVYGAVALARGWSFGNAGDLSSVVAVPLLSALGAGAFSLLVAPALSVVGQKITRRFGWNQRMFPLLLSCAATVALSVANAVCGWHWSAPLVVGGGLIVGAALNCYWLPLHFALRVLPRLDAKCGGWRARLENRRAPQTVSLS